MDSTPPQKPASSFEFQRSASSMKASSSSTKPNLARRSAAVRSQHASLTASSDSIWIILAQAELERIDSSRVLKIRIGVCAMEKKANSKPMKEILARITSFNEFEVVHFSEKASHAPHACSCMGMSDMGLSFAERRPSSRTRSRAGRSVTACSAGTAMAFRLKRRRPTCTHGTPSA